MLSGKISFMKSMYGRKRGFLSFLRWVSLALIFAAVLLAVYQLVRYSRIRNSFPAGMVIAGVPVGGLDQQESAERLTQAYGVSVELHYKDAVIQIKPTVVGFELDLSSMLAAADLQRVNQQFWAAFWDFLWNRLPEPVEVPLDASVSEERLRNYLETEIVSRYDQNPSPYMPVPGEVYFQAGESGTRLDIDRAVTLIEDAMRSPSSRVVNLTYGQVSASRPSLDNLQVMLQQVIDTSGFDGITEIFMLDLQNGQELNFAYSDGEIVPEDVAFTAASTVKIPIMVSVYRRVDEPAPEKVTELIELMVERSENDPADELMEEVIDSTLGPLEITKDMQALGLENTFLAGHFYIGAPLLYRYETPANSRTDIYTDPDVYNQTTPSEMGMLLEDLYQCSESGGGAFSAVFPGEISQSECDLMINYLNLNRIGVLIQAGLPDGTKFAHKHGWITEGDGLIHTIGDVGIVYTPSADFILCIYMYHPVQLVWDPANVLMAQLGKAVYNYYNQFE